MPFASEPLFAAIDVGTGGARATAFDLTGCAVADRRVAYATAVPNPGWAEQNSDDWGDATIEALSGLVERVRHVEAIGLTGQSPTVAPIDAAMRPVGPGMLYRDNRAVAEARLMLERFTAREFHDLTGHVPEAFHIGPKILWLRKHRPECMARTRWLLQPRDVALWRLTGEIATDESHLNSTLFFDLSKHRWNDDLCQAFGIDRTLFATARPAWEAVAQLSGRVAALLGLPATTPVILGGVDSQCLMFGADVVDPGPASENAGTSSTVNSPVIQPLRSPQIPQYAHVVPGRYATELGMNTGGGAITWALGALGYPDYASLGQEAGEYRERIAGGRQAMGEGAGAIRAVDSAPLFFPYLADGERDNPAARAAFVGVSERHTRGALAFAVREGISLTLRRCVGTLERAGSPVRELRVSGGAARLDVLGQVKADVMDRPTAHFEVDAAALGAAMLAASAAGYENEARAAVQEALRRARHFEPDAFGAEFENARAERFRRAAASAVVRAFAAE